MQEHIITNSDGGMKSSNDGKWDPTSLSAYNIWQIYGVTDISLALAFEIDALYNCEIKKPEGTMFFSFTELLRFYKRLQQPILDGKYPAYNFCNMKSQESLDQIYESARRHFKQYLDGDTTEDHYSAVLANMCFMHIIHSNIQNNKDFYEI